MLADFPPVDRHALLLVDVEYDNRIRVTDLNKYASAFGGVDFLSEKRQEPRMGLPKPTLALKTLL